MSTPVQDLIPALPAVLRERTRVLTQGRVDDSREFVLYCMRTAMRIDENPALGVAIEMANAVSMPVLVYQELCEDEPYASDRHHTFVLQGARDVQRLIVGRNCGYAFHLQRPGQSGPHLKSLAARAALVVREDMPTEFASCESAQVAVANPTPVLAVDAACIVPMQLVGKAYDRAYAFRNATSQLRAARLKQEFTESRARRSCGTSLDLPFVPLDLQTVEIADLVSECDIDHAVGPVPHTIGGSSSGYQRWDDFKTHGLAGYAKRRNDALIDGVSRMSPYLHYGMVSPMRIAREAAEIGGDGAEKFLDELLIWRELAYGFCFYRNDYDRISALPEWAIATLAACEADPRPAWFSWESLARGKTGDVLWDAAQRSLLVHGELHNNVRMTWGKAILNWTPDARTALAMLIDLNHRYALDGRDPASYGGILWCLGQFDRPFPPSRPILGTVRARSTDQHSQRLDPQAYARRTTRPLCRSVPRVAVIGAGLSGIICARTLADHGFPVTVFEKSRGVGGRMATRRTENGLRFDHGAQYFTVRHDGFRRYVESWSHDGIVQPWRCKIAILEQGRIKQYETNHERFVAVPGMNAVCQHLARGLDIRLRTSVATLSTSGARWQLMCHDGTGADGFDVVIVSAPAPQTAGLLHQAPGLARRVADQPMRGCWALMVSFTTPLKLGFDAAFVEGSPLAWLANNSSKPQRAAQPECWVLHATPAWSHEHLEESAESTQTALLDAFWQAVGMPARDVHFIAAHRWRFALPTVPLTDRCLFDANLRVGACGDWCAGPRVEGAFLSGVAAAGRVMGLLNADRQPTIF